MIDIIPIGTKNGVVVMQGGEIGGEEWQAAILVDNDDYMHFGQTPNPQNGLTWAQVITGHARGTATIKAKFDSTPGQDLVINNGNIVDAVGAGYLGHDALHGLVIEYTVVAMRQGAVNSSPGSNMFEMDIKITDCYWTVEGP